MNSVTRAPYPMVTERTLVVILATIVAMSISAKIIIPLPFTPVPVTLQVLTVIMCGLLLEPKKALAIQTGYLSLILAGIPIGSSLLAGPTIFMGPTAGYLIGFLPAVYVIGCCREKFGNSFTGNLAAALLGIVVIYLFGTVWLAFFLNSIQDAWKLGVLPFVMIDIAKAIAAVIAFSGLKGVYHGK